MIKLVVFDWNGTILADTAVVVAAINFGEMPILKHPPITVADYQKFYDVPLRHYYQALGVSDEDHKKHAAALSEGFHNHYEQLVGKTRTRPGTRHALGILHEKNTTHHSEQPHHRPHNRATRATETGSSF